MWLKHAKIFSFCPFSGGLCHTQAQAFQLHEAVARALWGAAPIHLSLLPCAALPTQSPGFPTWQHCSEHEVVLGPWGWWIVWMAWGGEITAWSLPRKYAVGGGAPCYCHSPISCSCLGRRWVSAPVFIVTRAFSPFVCKILPVKKIGKWAFEGFLNHTCTPPSHSSFFFVFLLAQAQESCWLKICFGRLYQCLAATSHRSSFMSSWCCDEGNSSVPPCLIS